MTRRRENDEWTFPDRKQRWLRTHPTLTHLSYSFFTFFPMPRCSVVRPSWVNRNQVIMFHKRSLPKYGLLFFSFSQARKLILDNGSEWPTASAFTPVVQNLNVYFSKHACHHIVFICVAIILYFIQLFHLWCCTSHCGLNVDLQLVQSPHPQPQSHSEP